MAHNLADFLGEWYGDELPSDDTDSDVTVGTSAVQLVGVNARRIVLRVCNPSGAAIAIGRDASVTTTKCVIVLTAGQTLEMNFLVDTMDVTRSWWAVSVVGGNAIHILETIITGQVATQT